MTREEKKREFDKTVQKLIARNRVCQFKFCTKNLVVRLIVRFFNGNTVEIKKNTRSDSSTRKSETTENRETYEAILNRSQARFPDTTLPDKVNFDSKTDVDSLKGQFSSSIDRKIKNEEPIPFDQLHINAVHQRFVSADEMKFLILVDKLLSRGRSNKSTDLFARYNTDLTARSFRSLSGLRFTKIM